MTEIIIGVVVFALGTVYIVSKRITHIQVSFKEPEPNPDKLKTVRT